MAPQSRFTGFSDRARLALAAVGVLLVLVPEPGTAAAPTAEIKAAIDGVVEILNKPELQAKPDERRDLLRRRIRPVFDFEEISKRSLGVHWRDRTPQEKREFVALFTELLENSYLGKIEAYKGEKIRYVKEKMDPPYAQVDTVIETSRQQEIPVGYRLLERDGRWRIYDVVIEGISLVNNYRSQFAGILQKSSFEGLVVKLRATARRSGDAARAPSSAN